MKFLLDENADIRLAGHLRSLGHDVTAIARDYPQALNDKQVLRLAYAEERVLITNDSDFGQLIFQQGFVHQGVIFFRLTPVDVQTKIARLSFVLANYSNQLHEFLTVTDWRVRIARPSRPRRR
jgi:predicted nuclease of predicted toxin-antitoxin system